MIFSKNFEEHKIHLEIILDQLLKAGIKAKNEKCKLFQKEIEFLGYNIKENKISIPLKQRTKAIEYVIPKSNKELKSFLGFSSFFRKFLANYTEIALPLYKALSRNVHIRKKQI